MELTKWVPIQRFIGRPKTKVRNKPKRFRKA